MNQFFTVTRKIDFNNYFDKRSNQYKRELIKNAYCIEVPQKVLQVKIIKNKKTPAI